MDTKTLRRLAKQYGIPETEDIRDCIPVPQSPDDWLFAPVLKWVKEKLGLD
jgi:hypothetical protein